MNADIEGEELMAKLANFAKKEMEGGASPLFLVQALINTAGNVGAEHLDVRYTAKLFRNCADLLESIRKEAMN